MLTFGVMQALSNLAYFALALAGKSYPVMFLAVTVEHLPHAMGNVAVVALMMSLCDRRFSAFQYALLTTLSQLPRYGLGWPAGWVADHAGWPSYYVVSFLLGVPGLLNGRKQVLVQGLDGHLGAVDQRLRLGLTVEAPPAREQRRERLAGIGGAAGILERDGEMVTHLRRRRVARCRLLEQRDGAGVLAVLLEDPAKRVGDLGARRAVYALPGLVRCEVAAVTDVSVAPTHRRRGLRQRRAAAWARQ